MPLCPHCGSFVFDEPGLNSVAFGYERDRVRQREMEQAVTEYHTGPNLKTPPWNSEAGFGDGGDGDALMDDNPEDIEEIIENSFVRYLALRAARRAGRLGA